MRRASENEVNEGEVRKSSRNESRKSCQSSFMACEWDRQGCEWHERLVLF